VTPPRVATISFTQGRLRWWRQHLLRTYAALYVDEKLIT
jgi:hypothetical protein